MKNSKISILFVDDESQEIKYFQKAFAKKFDILTANSVNNAIKVIEKHHQHIGVVITDQRMPKQAGVELLDYTNKNYPDIVRILTTAYCDTLSAIEAINKAQVFRYISKPWDIVTLHDSLDQALNRFKSASSDEQTILESLDEDCNHWLIYSTHAHGDEFVYRSGLEAISCQYNRRINQHFKDHIAQQIKLKMDAIMSRKYTTDSVLKTIQLQQNKGFNPYDTTH